MVVAGNQMETGIEDCHALWHVVQNAIELVRFFLDLAFTHLQGRDVCQNADYLTVTANPIALQQSYIVSIGDSHTSGRAAVIPQPLHHPVLDRRGSHIHIPMPHHLA
ncbi:MAG: hypothetical protein FD153_1093 [Rhodospirillaceae bacterium]|nr:MAG: hypothetical protein FD153_1093 [Rhodospirillaceae bacterium]